MNNLEADLKKASNMIEGIKSEFQFDSIYPFTTENISGYITEFDLKNKSLLTVGSSSDQSINASMFECFDQTIYDICPFTKYYFYLKKAALLNFDLEQFCYFFCYREFPDHYSENNLVFYKKFFERLSNTLKELDYDSFVFWNNLLNKYEEINVRRNLFSNDEYPYEILKSCNLYLKDEESFSLAKETIKYCNPSFIRGNIYDLKIPKESKFDNVFLSNIASYNENLAHLKLIRGLLNYLNINGQIQMDYLYSPSSSILSHRKEYLEYYITKYFGFNGILGISNDISADNSILIHQKRIY